MTIGRLPLRVWAGAALFGLLAPLWLGGVLLRRGYRRHVENEDQEGEPVRAALLWLVGSLLGLLAFLWVPLLIGWAGWQRRIERKVGTWLWAISPTTPTRGCTTA